MLKELITRRYVVNARTSTTTTSRSKSAFVFIIVVLHRVAWCIVPGPLDKFGDAWQCEPVKLDICKDVQYNLTIHMGFDSKNPRTGKESQEDSKTDLELFEPLLRRKCSSHLRLLLCAVYIPFCSAKVKRPITACRPLCLKVKSDCAELMRIRNLQWPEALNCDTLPSRNYIDRDMCLDGGINESALVTKKPKTVDRKTFQKPLIKTRTEKIVSRLTYCRVLYLRNNHNYFFVDKLQACALGCSKDGLFTVAEKQLAERWMSALSCICGLLCVLSLAVVVFEYHNTCYPERTIIFITACYLFYSLAYIIRIIYSREGVTCKEEGGRRYLLIDGSGNLSCAATFLLTYCFTMAQNIWWVMLALSWFLSAGLKWRPDSIRKSSMYFHIFAWGIPCAMTVIILVIRKIDVNELTGLCFIGNRYENLSALRVFVLGPLFTFLVMGMMFLLFGVIALFRISRHNYDNDPPTRSKLERPLLPVGIYASIHTFFSTFIFASYFYEYSNKSQWYRDPKSPGPNFEVFLVRIVMDFMIGITAAIWLLAVHLPKCLKRKFYQPSGLQALPSEHSALASLKTRVDTSDTSI